MAPLTAAQMAMQARIEAAKEAKLGQLSAGNVSPMVNLILHSEMAADDERLKQACLRQSQRTISEGRYQDNDLPGIPRDFPEEVQLQWDAKFDPIDMRGSGQPILGDDQPSMKYFTSPVIPNAEVQISVFNTSPIIWPNRAAHPSYGIGNYTTPLPVGVRADDCYLGACWVATDSCKNLHSFFSTDIHPDGFPFPDRAGCGLAFMPRAHIKDFPDITTGEMVHDRRVGYVRCPDGQIVILGGEGFRADTVPDNIWANFHHHFIDVTVRSQSALSSVTNEPAEIARRPPPKANSALRPDDAVSRFDAAYEVLSRAVKDKSPTNLAGAYDPLTPESRRLILDNIPARGYDPAIPTFELLSQAMLAGNIHYAAIMTLQGQYRSSVDRRRHLVDDIDAQLDDLNERTDPMSTVFAAKLRAIRDELFINLTHEDAFNAELDRTLANIPSAGRILKALPHSIVPLEDREISELVVKAVPFAKIGVDSVGVYCFPIEKQGAKQTDQLLMKLLNPPKTEAASNAKPSDDLEAGSSQKKRKRKRPEYPDINSDSDLEIEYAADCDPHPDGKRWKYTYERVPGKPKQLTNRHLCRVFRVRQTGLSKDAEFIAAIEKQVNARGLGLSKAGRKFGVMVDLV